MGGGGGAGKSRLLLCFGNALTRSVEFPARAQGLLMSERRCMKIHSWYMKGGFFCGKRWLRHGEEVNGLDFTLKSFFLYTTGGAFKMAAGGDVLEVIQG